MVRGWVLFVPQEPHLLLFTRTHAVSSLGKNGRTPSGFHLPAFSQTVNQLVRSLEGKTAT